MKRLQDGASFSPNLGFSPVPLMPCAACCGSDFCISIDEKLDTKGFPGKEPHSCFSKMQSVAQKSPFEFRHQMSCKSLLSFKAVFDLKKSTKRPLSISIIIVIMRCVGFFSIVGALTIYISIFIFF
jgi:hypothetical protein